MKPYIVRPVEPGKAHVVDRATGVVVGWVVANYYSQWEAITPPGERGHGWWRYRANAAAAVWEATR